MFVLCCYYWNAAAAIAAAAAASPAGADGIFPAGRVFRFLVRRRQANAPIWGAVKIAGIVDQSQHQTKGNLDSVPDDHRKRRPERVKSVISDCELRRRVQHNASD